MSQLVLYEIWCKTDYDTFFAIPANCDVIDVGLLLDPQEDLEDLNGIGQQLVAQMWRLA